jgi:hypothetical protein
MNDHSKADFWIDIPEEEFKLFQKEIDQYDQKENDNSALPEISLTGPILLQLAKLAKDKK